MSSVTSACDLTDVLKQVQSFLVMWISLLTRLESIVQHSNISLLYVVWDSAYALSVESWKKNKHNTKFLHASFMAGFLYHSPSQSITTYIFCGVNFFMYFEQVL